MEIHEITRREYDLFTTEPFSAFETSAFCELNRDKVDELAYLLFKDGKMRFTAVAGIADGVKGPILRRVARDKTHPCNGDAVWIFKVTGERME